VSREEVSKLGIKWRIMRDERRIIVTDYGNKFHGFNQKRIMMCSGRRFFIYSSS